MVKRRAETRDGMIVTTVALSPDLHRRLVVAALEDNATSAVLIRDALEMYLDQRNRRKKGKPS